MAPNNRVATQGGRRGAEPQGFFSSTYQTLTSQDNRAMVTSIGVFGLAISILHSSWGELLLPPSA